MKIVCIKITYILIAFWAFWILSDMPVEACNYKEFYIESYGKDLGSIKRLVSEVNKNKGGRIVFPPNKKFILTIGNDFNSGHRLLPEIHARPFSFEDCKYIEIDLNGSTIVLDRNNSTKYALFYFYNCGKFSLKNGSIIGDADKHDYSPVTFNGRKENTTHEWGHGVMIIGSKGYLSNIRISNMSGDGVYIASRKVKGKVKSALIEIDKCEISYCRRNGITCASNIGFSLTNSSIHHIGSYGALRGTSPMAGIDYEYEDGAFSQGNVIISNCTITDCENKTISASNVFPPKVSEFKIKNSTFSGSSFHIANLTSSRGKKVQNCIFKEAPINCGNATMIECEFIMGSKLHYVNGTSFTNCKFEGSLENLNGPYGCAIVGNSLDKARFTECEFRNIRGLNNTSPAYQGISGFNFPLVAHFERCSFYNTSFVKGNPKYDSSFTFEGCVLNERCMIYNEGGTVVSFYKSMINNVDSYPTQEGLFMFKDCEIIQNDESIKNPILFFGTHHIKNCQINNTLKITPQMKARGVERIKFIGDE